MHYFFDFYLQKKKNCFLPLTIRFTNWQWIRLMCLCKVQRTTNLLTSWKIDNTHGWETHFHQQIDRNRVFILVIINNCADIIEASLQKLKFNWIYVGKNLFYKQFDKLLVILLKIDLINFIDSNVHFSLNLRKSILFYSE